MNASNVKVGLSFALTVMVMAYCYLLMREHLTTWSEVGPLVWGAITGSGIFAAVSWQPPHPPTPPGNGPNSTQTGDVIVQPPNDTPADPAQEGTQ